MKNTEGSYDLDVEPQFGKDGNNFMVLQDDSLLKTDSNRGFPKDKKTSMSELQIVDTEKSNEQSMKKSESGLEAFLEQNSVKMSSVIHKDNNESSGFIQNSQSFLLSGLDENNQYTNVIDEYADDEDIGYDIYEVGEKEFAMVSKQLAEKYDFPSKAMYTESSKKKKVDESPDRKSDSKSFI